MQRARPSMTCDCTPETMRIVTAIHECTCPPPSDDNNTTNSDNPRTISLGDVLCTGRLLVRNWERLNGCFNASNHLDAAMLRTIAEAANGLIGLYESVGVSVGILPAMGQGERAGSSRMVTSPYTISSTPSRAPAGNTAVGNTGLVAVHSATYLGAHALEEEEAVIVGRETLRHSVLLLGEILHDISKDFGDLGSGGDMEDTRAILDKSSTDMLRLLGRINI
ncbi:hypothetical protein F5883DRAFT_720859 [Diaporthe sp. PMI_573]|nr:hypothetical protein F5883DRAFT_720859 [Diaporthaceae sp. PMI_573]